MSNTKPVRFNAQLMLEDMTIKGWTRLYLSKRAGVADMTVIRFFRGDHQTAVTARKLAKALGYSSARRYVISSAPRSAVA